MSTLSEDAFGAALDMDAMLLAFADDGSLTIMFNLVADVLYAWLDPKIRY